MVPEAAAEPFHMRVDACFTITGRGTVVVGEVLSGIVRTGDALVLEHAGTERTVTCRGVEMISVNRSRDGAPTYAPIGLLLHDVEKFDPVDGDLVRAVESA
jgi:selenocysteine-specific translation elongation factor